jgi:hypothetical protein
VDTPEPGAAATVRDGRRRNLDVAWRERGDGTRVNRLPARAEMLTGYRDGNRSLLESLKRYLERPA